jgi:4-amino-4-deoxy-L-arabinose transferase-like glycosyltransferase
MKFNIFKVTIVAFFIFLFGVTMIDSTQAAEPYNLGVALSITGTGALIAKME